MRVMNRYSLQDQIQFLRLRRRERKTAVDKSPVPNTIPSSFRFVLCQDFYVWLPCEASLVQKTSPLEEHVVKRSTKPPVFTGFGTRTEVKARLQLPELNGEELLWLQALLYRAFGHRSDALHPEARQAREANFKVFCGAESTGNLQEIITAMEMGIQHDLF